MKRIEQCFAELRSRGEKVFIPYITAGDPTLKRTEEFLYALEAAGADIVEFGVPFSDPIGDGVVNQEAAQRALKHNVGLRDILSLIRRVRESSEIPIVLFSYYNTLLAYGIEVFAKDAAEVGVDGVLCVDLPPEEASEYKNTLDASGLGTIFLIAPTTSDDRIKLIADYCTGFVYYISRLGVTGPRAELEIDLFNAVSRIKAHTDKPVAVGFGISTPEQAREVASMADGVVVGSAIVKIISELGDSPVTTLKIGAFVKSLINAIKR